MIDMKCGFEHCLALTRKRKVYGWGCHLTHGQLGIDCERTREVTPSSYSWGLQLGRAAYRSKMPVLNRSLPDKIRSIQCGYNDSLCIDSSLICHVFGSTAFTTFKAGMHPNNRNGLSSDAYYRPYTFAKEFIVDGSCGLNHTVLLTIKNEVIMFGQRYLGLRPNKYKTYTHQAMGLRSNERIEKGVSVHDNTIVFTS